MVFESIAFVCCEHVRVYWFQIQLRDVRLDQIGKNQMREQRQFPRAQFFFVEN